MRKYFKVFWIPYLILGILSVCFIAYLVMNAMASKGAGSFRHNSVCDTKERVFDYADLLTEDEEARLERLIAQVEDECRADIVIVSLNESLEEFVHQYYIHMPIEDYIMFYADEFYESHAFGYNEPYGDGIIFVDNRYHEADGYMYDWVGTTGKVEDHYSLDMIDELLWATEEKLDENAYEAYVDFVLHFRKDMQKDEADPILVLQYSLVWALVGTLIFVLCTKHKRNKVTTSERTYLYTNHMNVCQDVFLRKSVTKRHIDTSSGSSGSRSRSRSRGGGGSHRSRSGRRHGGGGHRRR